MSDPYGYADAPTAAPTGQAVQSMYAGLFALICAAVGPCLCYVPYLVALPLGGYAIFAGSQVRGGSDALAASEKAMATGGMIAGSVAVLLAVLIMLFVAAYVILVFGIVAAGN